MPTTTMIPLCDRCNRRPAQLICTHEGCTGARKSCVSCNRHAHSHPICRATHYCGPLCTSCGAAVGNIVCATCNASVCKSCFLSTEHARHSPCQRVDHVQEVEIRSFVDEEAQDEESEGEVDDEGKEQHQQQDGEMHDGQDDVDDDGWKKGYNWSTRAASIEEEDVEEGEEVESPPPCGQGCCAWCVVKQPWLLPPPNPPPSHYDRYQQQYQQPMTMATTVAARQ